MTVSGDLVRDLCQVAQKRRCNLHNDHNALITTLDFS